MLAVDSQWLQLIGIALALAIGLGLVMLLLTRYGQQASPARIRLDWFLPVLRRQKPGLPAYSHRLVTLARQLLPRVLFSDRQTKRRGLARRWLRKFGLSWLASPLRRLSQTACWLAFFFLFLVVCWPYSARIRPQGQTSGGWKFSEIDQATGELVLLHSGSAPVIGFPEPSDTVFLEIGPPATTTLVEAAQISGLDGDEIRLLPPATWSDPLLDALFLETEATWSLREFDPHAWPSHYADDLAGKEWVPAEFFLAIDPLVSLSTAIASRSWVWSLGSAAMILLVCIVVPRGFCGYICPLGTTIDLFDWAIGKRITRFRVASDGWWVHIKYYLLAGTLVSALGGVLVSGFVAAIPVITRAALLLVDPLQSGFLRGWHLIPGMHAGHAVSILLFCLVLALGLLRPRFWCKYVCPSGAVFSLGNLFRLTERKVESSCIHCNKCVEICPFDAIKPDFTTRETDCTLCQSCGGVCPTHAIKFVERGNRVELKVLDDPPTRETSIGRRGFLSLATGSTAAVVGGVAVAGATKWLGAASPSESMPPIRPPGSVPEPEFLEMCIRCGECFKVCPNNVLQLQGFEHGWEGLWTPRVNADWAGCESSCNACGQVCPTGAIRALPLEEKRFARMGLAVVNENTCLPFAGLEDCDLCVQECNAAGYEAIEYVQVGTEVDERGQPIEGTGYLAPVVLEDLCVGCGLCQTRCVAINAKERKLLAESAIVVQAGEGKEDRLREGSYRALHAPKCEMPPASSGTKPKLDLAPDAGDAEPEKSFGENPFGL